jgi:2-C-methyl-D-erythritol 4-phosphate cytidylyltransferase/2-C-methyl-D-erythritol 2,4-cyclodiphosphate synthase
MKVAALIVAAGSGSRVGGDIPKQYSHLSGRPVLAWSIDALARAGLTQIAVAIDPAHEPLFRNAAAAFPDVVAVPGGLTRTASVRAGLAALSDADIILIHDAARPGLTPEIVHALTAAIATGAKAVAPALRVADALARTEGDKIQAEIDRAALVRVQTPQAFYAATLRNAYALAGAGASFSDDLAVVRAAGVATHFIPGDIRLSKITYAEDYAVLERLLSSERITCVGSGIDAHRFGPGDHVTLCGVKIAHDKGLIGHSDADAGWHALVDAILGALGEGDIGAHFPPSDPQWKGANSETFLRHAAALARQAGARIVHVDITLVCEKPKIGPHREAMRARTAEVLALPLSRVSVKATTTERMGFLGREEGLAAQATATLDRPA